MQIVEARIADGAAIEALLDAAFGSGRRARTAYQLRDGAVPIITASLVARDGDTLAGSVQCWPLLLLTGARACPLTLLGPLAVDPVRQGAGVGKALLGAALAAADSAGLPPVLLIGDLDYYAPFGFANGATAGWKLPGPVERHRVLLRGGAGLPRRGRLSSVTAQRLAA